MLSIAFVIGKCKKLVVPYRSAQGCAEVIALKGSDPRLVKIIARIERAVAKELIHRTVDLVATRGGDNRDLCPGPFAVVSTIGIAPHVELSYRLHSQQLPAPP